MGDRCYMSVTCRRQDLARFEKLGFQIEPVEDQNTPVIEMVDEEANYAHTDEMPTDIPYTAEYGAGGNYGEGKIACDGKVLAEVAAWNEDFVVSWDFKQSRPAKHSLKDIRQFIRVKQRVDRILKKLRASEPRQHRFSPTTHLCIHCGIHADDDLLENQPCTA